MNINVQALNDMGFRAVSPTHWVRDAADINTELSQAVVGPNGYESELLWRARYGMKNGEWSWESAVTFDSPVAALAHAEIENWGGKRVMPPEVGFRLDNLRGIELWSGYTKTQIKAAVDVLGLDPAGTQEVCTFILSRCRSLCDTNWTLEGVVHALWKPATTNGMRQQFKENFRG